MLLVLLAAEKPLGSREIRYHSGGRTGAAERDLRYLVHRGWVSAVIAGRDMHEDPRRLYQLTPRGRSLALVLLGLRAVQPAPVACGPSSS